jgi:hypothetical protein
MGVLRNEFAFTWETRSAAFLSMNTAGYCPAWERAGRLLFLKGFQIKKGSFEREHSDISPRSIRKIRRLRGRLSFIFIMHFGLQECPNEKGATIFAPFFQDDMLSADSGFMLQHGPSRGQTVAVCISPIGAGTMKGASQEMLHQGTSAGSLNLGIKSQDRLFTFKYCNKLCFLIYFQIIVFAGLAL